MNYLLDGGDNNDAFSNVNLPIPFPDAVQEFSVQTNGVSAQYGLHPGGVVNIVTKSGTNALPRRPVRVPPQLRSERPASAAADRRAIRLKRSQFGGVVGGSIIKDKLFFFGGYQGTRQRSNPAATIAHVPTAAALQWRFQRARSGAIGGRLPGVRAHLERSGQRRRSVPGQPDPRSRVSTPRR